MEINNPEIIIESHQLFSLPPRFHRQGAAERRDCGRGVVYVFLGEGIWQVVWLFGFEFI